MIVWTQIFTPLFYIAYVSRRVQDSKILVQWKYRVRNSKLG